MNKKIYMFSEGDQRSFIATLENTEYKFIKQPNGEPLATDAEIPMEKAFRKDGQLRFNVIAIFSKKMGEQNFEILFQRAKRTDDGTAPRTHQDAVNLWNATAPTWPKA